MGEDREGLRKEGAAGEDLKSEGSDGKDEDPIIPEQAELKKYQPN